MSWSFIKYMAETNTKTYEFSITVEGIGDNVDQAFSDALEKLSKDPHNSITNEVIYVVGKSDEESEEPEEESSEEDEKEVFEN